MCDRIIARAYFDGIKYHADGPYVIDIENGIVKTVMAERDFCLAQSESQKHADTMIRVPFAMPGLVEAHAHIFLDGGELDLVARSEYLKAPFDSMMGVASRNLRHALAHGVTLIRDAGDKYGINHAARELCRKSEHRCFPDLRSAGLGIRRPARYGSFMAYDAAGDEDIVTTVNRIADEGADDIKIIQTGIIDFATGQVKGEPQFDTAALSLIVNTARNRGLKTFAHCSGLSGLEVAVQAGVDSVEHGFFINEELLKRMRDRQIAWVPTFSPVCFQRDDPKIVGWDSVALGHLRHIVEDHLRHVRMAYELGVPLVAGSDAGSHGVHHGRSLINELYFFLSAGLPMESVLTSATWQPRRLWGMRHTMLAPGALADIVCLNGNPFADSKYLRDIAIVFKNGAPVSTDETIKACAYA
ncbi:MAG TPA: amidohydrolase family protein [Noviherbaspirillum sp.]|uniref:amidohydrolase family protein n=1 Tax=Noviherbaspirillum sp. TaxID=1926288 RepID=UPI002B49DC73|nr:amidohydrolase family protein [Noviherbaspirillum sp.]HJV88188.1 amidohydrolase family protein [Noviherbaspirillum sp.]